MNGVEIATAFNAINDKRHWKAKSVQRERNSGALDVVHFDQINGMVTLSYDVEKGRFAVKFHKLQAAWGDYIKGIGRSLYVVLNTLKAAGLPFDAPTSMVGLVVVAETGDNGEVWVSFPPSGPPADYLPGDYAEQALSDLASLQRMGQAFDRESDPGPNQYKAFGL